MSRKEGPQRAARRGRRDGVAPAARYLQEETGKRNWWRNSTRVADILFFRPRDVQAHRRQSRSCAEGVNVDLYGGWLRAWNRSGKGMVRYAHDNNH